MSSDNTRAGHFEETGSSAALHLLHHRARHHALVPGQQRQQLARASHRGVVHLGEVYNIGGGSRVSLAATLEQLAAIAGRPLDVRHHERESGDVQDTGAAIDRAREALGFEPATELRDGLQAEFEWVLEHSPARSGAVASAG